MSVWLSEFTKNWKNQLHFIKKALSHLDNLQISLKFPYGPGYQLPYLELVWIIGCCPTGRPVDPEADPPPKAHLRPF
jgi:hypothetical protein